MLLFTRPLVYLDNPDIPREGRARRGSIYHQLLSCNQKLKGAFTLFMPVPGPTYYLMVLLSSALAKTLTTVSVCLRIQSFVLMAILQYRAHMRLSIRPSRTGRHPPTPPRPALQLTHAGRTFRSVHAVCAELLLNVRRARVLSARVRMVYSSTPSHANCYTHKRDWSRPWSEEV